MIDKRNEIEMLVHHAIHDFFDTLGHKMGQSELTALLGRLRDVKVMLDNKQFGCWSGHHASACSCREGHPGQSL